MFGEMLLMSGWILRAQELPHALKTAENPEFALPGALSLMEFSDLLGVEEDEIPARQNDAQEARFSIPGMLPQGTRGEATLSREIDFGRLMGTRAMLEIDHLCGTGDILLGEERLLSFCGGAQVALDVTDALRLRRKQTLTIRFDDAQQAGIFGTAILHTADQACIETLRLCADAARQTLAVEAVICAQKPGAYALRAAIAGTREETENPWRETRVQMDQAGTKTVNLALSMRAAKFEAGRPYAPPVLKVTVSLLPQSGKGMGMLADARTIMTGYPGDAPGGYVPLSKEDCALAPDELLAHAKGMHVSALSVPQEISGLLFRRAALEGVALLVDGRAQGAVQSPCAVEKKNARNEAAVSPAAACWQLCGMPAMPPAPDAQATDRELLLDAAGRDVDLSDPQTECTMASLRALMIRLRAEAARQGQYAGALCAVGEWREVEIAGVMAKALKPLHLSVLPLRGAWWAQSFFSATVQAFIPQEERNGAYSAQVELLDADGARLASFSRDVSWQDGPLGIIEGRLPDDACVLTLRARLRRSGALVLEEEFPVYVGVRGPLEAAFSL